MNEQQTRKASAIPGLAIIGLFVIAAIASVIGLVAAIDSRNYWAAGFNLFVGAAALGVIATLSFK